MPFALHALAASVIAVALLGCAQPSPGGATATWRLAPGAEPDAAATSIDVLVTRLDCNNGLTGTVDDPTVEVLASEVVITITVSPGPPQVADCRGNDEVLATVRLPQPLGDRPLVDGACRTTKASSTVFCESEVRSAP